MSALAWNAWYHINGNTYGTWLRDDPRGLRARRHREHVQGDYKKPSPPGMYDKLHARSRALLARSPVVLSPQARQIALESIREALQHHRILIAAIAIDDHHYHILAKFTDHQPRKWIGIAKKRSARRLSDLSLASTGGVWAIRCKVTPVKDRVHQLTIVTYIEKHADRGAAVWTIRSSLDRLGAGRRNSCPIRAADSGGFEAVTSTIA